MCSESVGSWNFEILVEDSDTGGPSSVTVSWDRIRICFSYLILWALCERNNEGEAESIISFLLFLAFSQLNLSRKFELTIFPSYFRKCQAFFANIFNSWGKTIIWLVFLSVSTIWTVKYCTKNLHFQCRISVSLFMIFYSLSSCPFPARLAVFYCPP